MEKNNKCKNAKMQNTDWQLPLNFGDWTNILFFEREKSDPIKEPIPPPEKILEQLHKSIDLSLRESDPEKKQILIKEQYDFLQKFCAALQNFKNV